MIANQFTPFFGFVEDVDDPQKLGRVRVRVVGYHSQNEGELPAENLQWMLCVVNNSESQHGVGTNPVYEQGSMVFGYFVDSLCQTGLIVGSINGGGEEFNDINRLARNEEIDQTIVQDKRDNVKKDVETPSGTWDEPEPPYDAQYPYNKVTQTRSGHVMEADDTQGAERLHVYHRTGSFYEIHPDGSQVVKIVKDNYTLIAGTDYFCIDGDIEGFVAGDANIKVEGKAVIDSPEIQLGEDSDVEQSLLGGVMERWLNENLINYLNNVQIHTGNLGVPTSVAITPILPNEAAPGGELYSKKNTNQ